MTFDPNSNDAMFAKIMERLDELKADVKAGRQDTDKRLREIEQWRDGLKGAVATVSAVVSAVAVALIELVKSLWAK